MKLLLLLTVAVYLAIVVTSAWAAVASFLRPGSLWARHRGWVRLVMVIEIIYMLQAPACVYLPRAPGKPAVQRHLLGADPAGHLYWLESTAPMAFVWGPRWWISFRPDITLIPFVPYAAGLEYVAPLRYAVWTAAGWDVVSGDGRRWPVPEWHGSAGTMQSPVPRAIASDGTLLSLEPTGIGRFASSGGLRRLAPSAAGWECVPPCGLPSLGTPESLATSASGSIWEIFESGSTGEISMRQLRGERLFRTRVRSIAADSTPRVFELSLHQKPGNAGPSGGAGTSGNGVVLFLSRWEGEGTVYEITSDGHSRVLSTFSFGRHKAPGDRYTSFALPAFAMSSDQTLFTTGQAIFEVNGAKRSDLVPPLESAVWVGHTLHGVRSYPFFADLFLERSANHSQILAAAAHGDVGGHESLPTIRDGLRRSAWVLGGVDESGREDEIVSLATR